MLEGLAIASDVSSRDPSRFHVLEHVTASSARLLSRRGEAGECFAKRLRERVYVPRGHDAAVVIGTYEIPDAAHVGCNERPFEGQGFDHHRGQRFVKRGLHDQIGRRNNGKGVVPPPQETHLVAKPQADHTLAEIVPFWSGSDQEEQRFRLELEKLTEGFQEYAVAFLRVKSTDADDRLPPAHSQIPPEPIQVPQVRESRWILRIGNQVDPLCRDTLPLDEDRSNHL